MGGYYEGVVAEHASALQVRWTMGRRDGGSTRRMMRSDEPAPLYMTQLEASRRLREEARANAAAAELAAVQDELARLRAQTAEAQAAKPLPSSPGTTASGDGGTASGASPGGAPTSTRTQGTPAGSSSGTFSTGQGGGGRRGSVAGGDEQLEYLRLHFENELAVQAKKAAESQVRGCGATSTRRPRNHIALPRLLPPPPQAYAVAAVRSVLQGQLDDLNSIFEVQLAEGKREAALVAAREARAENADVERRVAAAVAEAVAAAQHEADRQRVEAVRAALALAAGGRWHAQVALTVPRMLHSLSLASYRRGLQGPAHDGAVDAPREPALREGGPPRVHGD